MAKKSYGIPYSLNETSYLDLPITIKTEGGISARPITIKSLLIIMSGIVGGFLVATKTFIARGNLLEKGIFLLLWGILCAFLLTTTKTREYGYHRLGNLYRYLSPNNRFVNTRRVASAFNMAMFTGFAEMDPRTGIIKYTDGTLGMLFDVIGTGSYLLFDSHKNAIIDRVDSHYRKMHPGATYHFVTVKRPQEVDDQTAALDAREDALTVSDPDLTAMMESERGILKRYVGSKCKSLHQYMLLQAKTEEDLSLAFKVLQAEVENSSLMFKRVVQLGVPEAQQFFAGIYSAAKGEE